AVVERFKCQQAGRQCLISALPTFP
ncbi:hypothetical protein pipiens_017077, partial [Culex pipiens pipiens]